MTLITTANLHPNAHRVANRLFRYGLIIGDPLTNTVFGYYVSRKLDGAWSGHEAELTELAPYCPEGEPVLLKAWPEDERFGIALRWRYPNCRVRVIGRGKAHQLVSRYLADQVRLRKPVVN